MNPGMGKRGTGAKWEQGIPHGDPLQGTKGGVGARAPWLSSVVSYKVFKVRGLRTAVAGDEPPLLGFSRLSELPHPPPGRVLVRDSLPAVPSGLEVFGDGHRPGPRSRQLPQTWMTLQGMTLRPWPAALAGRTGNLPGVPRP